MSSIARGMLSALQAACISITNSLSIARSRVTMSSVVSSSSSESKAVCMYRSARSTLSKPSVSGFVVRSTEHTVLLVLLLFGKAYEPKVLESKALGTLDILVFPCSDDNCQFTWKLQTKVICFTFKMRHMKLLPVIPIGQYDSSFPCRRSRRLVSMIRAQDA